jgi:hypothetical protein
MHDAEKLAVVIFDSEFRAAVWAVNYRSGITLIWHARIRAFGGFLGMALNANAVHKIMVAILHIQSFLASSIRSVRYVERFVSSQFHLVTGQ